MTIREIETAISLPPTNRERQALKAALGWLRGKGLAESIWEDSTGTLWRVVEGGEIPSTWLDRPTAEEALVDGMTIRELAEATGRTESSVASSLRRLEECGKAWGEWIPGRHPSVWHRGPAPWLQTVSEKEDNQEEEA